MPKINKKKKNTAPTHSANEISLPIKALLMGKKARERKMKAR